MPRLRRWAQGRLPDRARGVLDTEDIVQDVLLQTLIRIERFVPRHRNAFHAYLRRAVRHRILDEIHRSHRRPAASPIDSDRIDGAPSPLERAVGRETLRRYELGLRRLNPDARVALVLRVEMKLSFEEIAAWLGRPSANAARMVVSRALVHLAQEMDLAE